MEEKKEILNDVGRTCENLVLNHLKDNEKTTILDDLTIITNLSLSFLKHALNSLAQINISIEDLRELKKQYDEQSSVCFQQAEIELKKRMN